MLRFSQLAFLAKFVDAYYMSLLTRHKCSCYTQLMNLLISK